MVNKKLFEGTHNPTPEVDRRIPLGYEDIEGSEYIEYGELLTEVEADIASFITSRNYINPTVSTGVLTFNFNSKNECFANKSGGGGIVINENITIAYSNATNFKTMWASIEVTTSTRTITFPSNHISGDSRWTALVLTLPVGVYQLSVMYDGSKYHVVCSQMEV